MTIRLVGYVYLTDIYQDGRTQTAEISMEPDPNAGFNDGNYEVEIILDNVKNNDLIQTLQRKLIRGTPKFRIELMEEE
jgi:hypothetical protein